jgi:phosphatidylglycerol:prolipoprotein diacylglycerol transferase
VLAWLILSLYYGKKEGVSGQTILDLALYVMIASIVGARLVYVLGQWDYFRANPLEIIMVQNGGLVFLGGLLLALLAVALYARLKHIPLLKLMDIMAPGTTLGYVLGRLGCFLNGCCFGLPTNLPWGVVFPPGSLAAAYCPDQVLHPTQLYSSLAMFFSFLFLIRLYRQKKFDGQILFWGLTFYSLYRFLVEFLRFSPIHWLGLTPSQWLAIVLFIFGLWGLSYFRNKTA